MAERMVKVQNMVNKIVVIKKPEYNINRRWSQKGQTLPIPFDSLQQAMWDQSVRNMFDRGMLYIESMKDKIDLQLEPEEAEKPQNIIVLNDTQIHNLLVNQPLAVFKKEVSELSDIQIREIVNYAIVHQIANVDKAEYLKSLTGVDILKSISRDLDVQEAERKQ